MVESAGGREYPLTRCPQAYYIPATGSVMAYLSLASKHGVLPVEGGMLDQTAVFIEALGIWGEEIASLRNREVEKAGSGSGAP